MMLMLLILMRLMMFLMMVSMVMTREPSRGHGPWGPRRVGARRAFSVVMTAPMHDAAWLDAESRGGGIGVGPPRWASDEARISDHPAILLQVVMTCVPSVGSAVPSPFALHRIPFGDHPLKLERYRED
jgi:hypothetical protein